MATRSSKRGRKRKSATNDDFDRQLYDLSKPENWSVSELKAELAKKGIVPENRAKKCRLVQLFKESQSADVITHDSRDSGTDSYTAQLITHATPAGHGRTGGIPLEHAQSTAHLPILENESSSGTDNTTVIQLQHSVTSLQKTVSRLTESLEKIVDNNRNTQTINQSSTDDVSMPMLRTQSAQISSTATLGAPMPTEGSLFTNNNNNNMNFGMDRQINLENARTSFGYSAEALPFVETVHPSVKKQIQQGNDVNLASLLIPYYNSCEPVPGSAQKPDPRLNNVLTLSQLFKHSAYTKTLCARFTHIVDRNLICMSGISWIWRRNMEGRVSTNITKCSPLRPPHI